MKKAVLLPLFLSLAFASVSAQAIAPQLSEKQWDDLLTAVRTEDWVAAFDLSKKYIDQLKDDDRANSIANLRYIFLFSAAGKVSVGDMSYDQLANVIKGFEGKKVTLPFHTVRSQCNGNFNFICPGDTNARAMITATNAAGTTILFFEYVTLKDEFDFKKHEGQIGSIAADIESIAPNPNKSNLVIMRLYLMHGEIKIQKK